MLLAFLNLKVKNSELINMCNCHDKLCRNYRNLEFSDKLAKIRYFDSLTYKALEKIYEKYS